MAVGGPTVTLHFRGDTDHLRREIAGIGTAIAGIGIGVGVLGGLGAAASVAVAAIAAIPAAFLGIGIIAAAQSERVKAAFTGLKDHVIAETRRLAAPIEGELVRVADLLRAAFDRLRPALGEAFAAAAPMITRLTQGIIALVEGAMPGLLTAMRAAGPVVDALARGLGWLGEGIGGFFAALSAGVPGAVVGLDALFTLVRDLLVYLGQLIAQLANALAPVFARLAPVVMDVVRAIGDALMPVVVALAPLAGDLAGMLGEVLVPVLGALGAILRPVAEALATGLRPVIPVITQAFRELTPVMMQIAQQAGPLLAEIIIALAPLVLELVRTLAALLKASLPLIPPLLELARNVLPIFAGVIRDVVVPVLAWLTQELIKFVAPLQQWYNEFAVASRSLRTAWDDIKRVSSDGVSRIRADIDSLRALPDTMRRWWDGMLAAVRAKGEEILAWVRGFPGRIVAALGDVGRSLYDSGARMLQGFADGVRAQAAAVTDSVRGVVSNVRGLFPGSPAKWGPFSGSGYTYESGMAMIRDFARGIMRAAPELSGIAQTALRGARVTATGFTGAGGTIAASAPGVGKVELRVAPGADTALSSMLMSLVRTGQLQLVRA